MAEQKTDTTENAAEQSRKAAIIAATAADSKKATDIIVQEVSDLIGVTDYFVIATTKNSNQAEAVLGEVEDALREQIGWKPNNREKSIDGSWSLLDYGDIVFHVFQPESREYYRLESLWNDAPLVDLENEAHLADLQYSDRIREAFIDGTKRS